MEMDVNLVGRLRSTVGMSDIDRCYNDFGSNAINITPIKYQQHSFEDTSTDKSVVIDFCDISTRYNISHNRLNHNILHQNSNLLSPKPNPIKLSSTLSSLSSSSSSSTSSSCQHKIRQYDKFELIECHPPPTISGNIIRNQPKSEIINNDNNFNNENEIDRLNIVNDNRIDCHQYYDSITRSIKSVTGTTATSKNTSVMGLGGTSSEIPTPTTPISKGCCLLLGNRNKINKTPQEIYFESRGKSCKKLLKFNGYSNKILLYPEESWARSAASSYWTIKPSWWQPNRCKVTEITGSQRYSTKAKMLCIEKGSLLVIGSFKKKLGDADFKLYLSSNITMEDYNMGYCLTGWVERRCSQSNIFQMTHFAVIKRQWPPSITLNSNSTSTNDSKLN